MKKHILFFAFLLFIIQVKLHSQRIPIGINIDPAWLNPMHPVNANLGFENGLTTWTATGSAFANQPVLDGYVTSERVATQMNYNAGGIGGDYWKGMPYPIGSKGAWIGTYENGNGDIPTGSLTSKPFIAVQRFISCLIGGGSDVNRLYVEVQIKRSDYDAAWTGQLRPSGWGNTDDGYVRAARMYGLLNSEDMYRYYIDLDQLLNHQFLNKVMRIQIVDNSSNSWGHINVDDFLFTPDLSNFLRINRVFPLLIDKNKPVWGFADLHTHPMNYLGFGGGFIYGSMFGPLDQVMNNCSSVHGIAGTSGSSFVREFAHSTVGHPVYEGFPKFSSKVHQQMHIEWIKRAYDGGLRFMSMLAVNNWFTSTRFMKKAADIGIPTNFLDANFTIRNLLREGFIPKDDKASADLQLLTFKAEIEGNPGRYPWLEIAKSADDARRIIAENKLAIILGVELDMPGNFLAPDAPWGRGDVPNFVNYLPVDLLEARRLIAAELDRLWAMGVRQITGFHYVETWGGTPLFQRMFNNVNKEVTGKVYRVEDGSPSGIVYNLDKDNGTSGLERFLTSGEIGNSHRDGSWDLNRQGQLNALGTNEYGRIFLQEMMKRGFLIDADHTSSKSFNEIIGLSQSVRSPTEAGYPILSSHTDPQEISMDLFSERNPGDRNSWNRWTTRSGFVKHEAQASANKYLTIKQSGGMVAPLLSMYRKQPYVNRSGMIQVENNCDGSSRTWAQMFLYSIDKMNNTRVALSTDRGFIDFIAPRFGVNGAAALEDESQDELSKTYRRQQVSAQKNGVNYDVPIRTYQHFRFDKWDNHYTGNENNMWRALATATVARAQNLNYRDMDFSNSRTLAVSGQNYDAMELTDGILKAWRGEAFNLDGKGITIWGEWRAAAFAGVKFIESNRSENVGGELVRRFGLDASKFNPIFNSFVEIYTSWKAMSGNNEPLRRHIVGLRDFDINLDGAAHYGMLPDFLQDVKNVGVTPSQLLVLFNSASDYLTMWEKAERMKVFVR